MIAFVDTLTLHSSSLSLKTPEPSFQHLDWAMLSNGASSLHECILFFGIGTEGATPVLVAKVPRLPSDDWIIRTEYASLVALWEQLGEQKAVSRIPRPIDLVVLQGQPTLITSYIDSGNLLHSSRKLNCQDTKQVIELAPDAGKYLAEILDQTATPLTAENRPISDFDKKAEKYKLMHFLLDAEIDAVSELENVIRTVYRTATHRILVHGDYWHGNMIRAKSHGELMLVDWQYSHWHVDAALDVYLFLLAVALSAAPEGDVRKKAHDAAKILMRWRDSVIPEFLSVFEKPSKYSLLPPRQGFLYCCIEKATRASLAIGTDQEEDLIWRFMFAELLNWEDGN